MRTLTAAAALVACGDGAATCSVEDNGDGTRTITCPGTDPVRVVDGDADASCTLGTGDDGGKMISCSDGTVVCIDKDGLVCFPGSGLVAGEATFFGLEDHAGIRVWAEGTEIETTTDEKGSYELGPLPAGVHVLHFEAPGRITQRRENVPVINGTWQMEPVQLKVGRWIADDGQVLPLPGGDAVLTYQSSSAAGGWLDLWELETGEEKPLGGVVSTFSFTDDGRFVLHQQRHAVDGPLVLWDREQGAAVEVTSRSSRGTIAPGGSLVVYEVLDDEGGCNLHLWRRESGETVEVDGCTAGAQIGGGEHVRFGDGDRSFLYVDEEEQIRFYDVASGMDHLLTGDPHAWISGVLQLVEGGRFALASEHDLDFSEGLYLLDGQTGERRLLAVERSGGMPAVAPGGDAILFVRNGAGSPELRVHRIAAATDLLLSSDVSIVSYSFSGDGERVGWIEGGLRSLRVLALDEPENSRRYPGGGVRSLRFVDDGSQRILVEETDRSLHLWTPATDEVELLEANPDSWLYDAASGTLAASTQQGELLLADLVEREEARTELDAGVTALALLPGGEGIVYRSSTRDGAELGRWVPPAESEVLGAGYISDFRVSAAGDVIFVECADGCVDTSYTLVRYAAEREVRDPIDAPVNTFDLAEGVLWYRRTAASPTAENPNGLYVVPMRPSR